MVARHPAYRPSSHQNSPRIEVVDVESEFDAAESTVSHHLGQLARAGLPESERRGMNTYHRARRDALAALCLVLDPNCCT